MVNHTHVTDLLCADFERAAALEDAVGEVLAFFWKMAVDRQFPEEGVVVKYDGDVIQIHQLHRTDGQAAEQVDAVDNPPGRH
jgi:hypothetical protein